ncbi:hypothetical protein [Motilimonas sp. KMU-193]|uniref:hypothetical protein n=1 Tax=Motilimonas sp. KMU-193 TaxID=3388668 RepID=UPI00396B25AF
MMRRSLPKYNHGVAALTVTLLLLVSATSFTFFSVKSRLMESKIAQNEYRYREAYVNAEAGLDHGLSIINSNGWKNATVNFTSSTNTAGNKVYVSTARSDLYTVTIEDYPAASGGSGQGAALITSVGKGKNGTTKTISRVARHNIGGILIEAPLVAAGTPVFEAAAFINANGNSKSVVTGGEDYIVNGSSATTSSVNTDNSDVRGDNFYRYFNQGRDAYTFYRARTDVHVVDDCSTIEADSLIYSTIWVRGDCNASGAIIGSEAHPVTLIIHNGNAEFSKAYGLVYALNTNTDAVDDTPLTGTNSRDLAKFVLGDGSTEINGALVVDYKYTFTFRGSVTINYQPDYITGRPTGDYAEAFWMSGGWEDV